MKNLALYFVVIVALMGAHYFFNRPDDDSTPQTPQANTDILKSEDNPTRPQKHETAPQKQPIDDSENQSFFERDEEDAPQSIEEALEEAEKQALEEAQRQEREQAQQLKKAQELAAQDPPTALRDDLPENLPEDLQGDLPENLPQKLPEDSQGDLPEDSQGDLQGDLQDEARATRPKDDSFYVYNWSNYIDPSIIVDFEARYKVKVQYKTYDSLDELRLLLNELAFSPEEASQRVDVIILPVHMLKTLAQRDLLSHIRSWALRNKKHIYPFLTEHLELLSEELGNTELYAIPYLWGTFSLAYNVAALRKRNPSFLQDDWGIVFDPQKAAQFSDCGITLSDRPRQIFQVLRQYLDISPDSISQEDIINTEIALRRLRPYVEVMSGFEVANALAYGDSCIIVAQSQEVFLSQKNAREIAKQKSKKRPPLTYRFPKQGSLLWMDVMIIPAQSEKLRMAHFWMDHILTTNNSRLIAEHTRFATPNQEAQKLLPDLMRQSKILYPKIKAEKLFLDSEAEISPFAENGDEDDNNANDEIVNILDYHNENELRLREERAWERFINLKKR